MSLAKMSLEYFSFNFSNNFGSYHWMLLLSYIPDGPFALFLCVSNDLMQPETY